MMEAPRIQYSKTRDGVNVAYWALGSGPTLVYLGTSPSVISLAVEWQIPELRAWYHRLADEWTLIGYDGRGSGLSDKGEFSCSLDEMVSDLEAVVQAAALENFGLFAQLSSAPIAVAYAARHPEKVRRMVLFCSWAKPSEYMETPRIRMLVDMMRDDWQMFTETVAQVSYGWEAGQDARAYARNLMENTTRDAWLAVIAGRSNHDVSSMLPQVQCPTLIFHRAQCSIVNLEVARTVAAGIPHSRLTVLEGAAVWPFRDDSEFVYNELSSFLKGDVPVQSDPQTLPSGTATILFTDIVESTALTERLGDAAFRARARELDATLRTLVREYAGTPVEGTLLGDGLLAVFTSARQAIDCALKCNAAAEGAGLPLHLGLHAGDVLREGNNVYGGAVNIAARIMGLTAPGQVLVSDTVRSLARTSAGVTFADQGEHVLKGIADPIRVFEVRAQ